MYNIQGDSVINAPNILNNSNNESKTIWQLGLIKIYLC